MADEGKGMQLIVNLLREILAIGKDLVKKTTAPVGRIKSFLMEAQDIVPEVAKFDAITFWGTVNAPGTIVAQATQVRVNPDYDFMIKGIAGFVADPNTNPTDHAAVTFQARVAGRSGDMFTTPINMNQLVSTAGPATPIEWADSGYLVENGKEVIPTFAIGGLGIVAHATRVYGITLYGTLVRKRS